MGGVRSAKQRRKSKRKQSYESQCLLLDAEDNQISYGLATFLREEFGQKLAMVLLNNSLFILSVLCYQ